MVRWCSVFVCLVLGVTVAAVAAPATRISGTVRNALTGAPVAGVRVTVEDSGQQATTNANGVFVLVAVDAGARELSATADGFLPERRRITIGAEDVALDFLVAPALAYAEAVTVSPGGRDTLTAYQPLTELSGQALDLTRQGTLGATLATTSGVSERSSGPGPSRPMIRGLDGDRVLILQDSQAMGDVSSQSADHGVNVNPSMADRIEIVRGPATLLYGANAIGGLVNVITNTIPAEVVVRPQGRLSLDGASAASEFGGAASAQFGRRGLAATTSVSSRRSVDMRTPLGSIANTAARSTFLSGGVSWIAPDGFIGASYSYDRAEYGLPPAFAADFVTLDPTRHSVSVRGQRRNLQGAFSSVRGSVAYRHYVHQEIEGGEVGTVFRNTYADGSVLATHRPVGRLSGTIGAELAARRFGATGEEALTPPIDQQTTSVFGVEEVSWRAVSLQAGARFEHTRYTPRTDEREPRRFSSLSASAGVVVTAGPGLTWAVNVARAARRPALEELYFYGLHIGNFAFEIGNDGLRPEVARGVDGGLRWSGAHTRGDITLFVNAIDDYIFRQPTGSFEDGLPEYVFVGRATTHRGIEARGEVDLAAGWQLTGGYDAVRASLDDGTPLPRIPARRGRLGLRYQRGAWQAGGDVLHISAQRRTFAFETPTAGSTVGQVFGAWSFMRGGTLHTITARVDNVTDRLYRSHLSFIKAFVPERGRDVRVTWTVDLGGGR